MSNLTDKFLIKRDHEVEKLVLDIISKQREEKKVLTERLFDSIEYGNTYEDITNNFRTLSSNYIQEFTKSDNATLEEVEALIRFKLAKMQSEITELLVSLEIVKKIKENNTVTVVASDIIGLRKALEKIEISELKVLFKKLYPNESYPVGYDRKEQCIIKALRKSNRLYLENEKIFVLEE